MDSQIIYNTWLVCWLYSSLSNDVRRGRDHSSVADDGQLVQTTSTIRTLRNVACELDRTARTGRLRFDQTKCPTPVMFLAAGIDRIGIPANDFFRIPKEIVHRGEKSSEFSRRRREKWVTELTSNGTRDL